MAVFRSSNILANYNFPLNAALCGKAMGLDTVEVLVHIEEQYDITIPDEDAFLLGEVGDLALYIVNSCEQNNGVLIELEPVVDYLKKMLHKEFDVPLKKINLKSHLVKDLGLD